MSSRLYPAYRRGSPQLRVFLPNFWMKLVKSDNAKLPANQIKFHVSPGMTVLDVKNYLEQIYQVPVMSVRTANVSGWTHEHKQLRFIHKDDDIKLAYVTLSKDTQFEFPDILALAETEKKQADALGEIGTHEKMFTQATKAGPARQGLPTFFGL